MIWVGAEIDAPLLAAGLLTGIYTHYQKHLPNLMYNE